MQQRYFSRRSARVVRSQIALRLGLVLYALLCTLFVLRCVVLFLQFPESVWTVQQIIVLTSPVVRPLQFIPGSSLPILGGPSLADLTIVLLLVAAPLAMLARPGPGASGSREIVP